jgi:hypothetical protein
MLKRIASSIAESLVDMGNDRENLESNFENSEGRAGEIDQSFNQRNFKTLNNNYTEKMAMIIKIGTGGDEQDHVHTPRSIRSNTKFKDIERPITKPGSQLSNNPYNI